ncbi:MAG TPA: UvrD-helicase domain-containing protein [Candidatus Pullichristensenella excrementigallinarum]|uniref:DNA 3'-5' helicase n=1 Tax=Candidatus Pullichristensenella excrementigallinarum TaxID=2840907 RepID=A0A9D1IC43_9FIRM|nr:UvrD-helicase domain-containing protein [Candidatus Pullichristensenella excrementigallinarum]
MQFTKEQQRAIDARGENLLLSAAAGSGKTSVLVERILSLIREGADVDRMLVVTFTRAAAQDMRKKLTSRLSRRAAEGDSRCREQLLRLDRACISTLHGFCAEFLRANFEAAGVDPSFRVLDDVEDARLLDEALDQALEEAYSEDDEALRALDDGRGPKRVRELARDLYAFLCERPEPEAWLASFADPAEEILERWKQEILRSAQLSVRKALLHSSLASSTPGCPAHYVAALEIDQEALMRLLALEDYEQLRLALREFKQARPSGRIKDVDAAVMDRVKWLRSAAARALSSAKILDLPLEQARADMRSLMPEIRRLGKIALDVGRAHDLRKAERSGLSYADLERYTLRALQKEEVASLAREQYDHVFVDEYQDVSDVQQALIERVSRGDNLFLVGDVKQSIYRFRQAEPGIFLNCYHRFQEGNGGKLLPLTKNFRSKAPILDLVNAVFERAMIGGDAEIVYDDLARLHLGLAPEEGLPVPEIHILDESLCAGDTEEMDEEILEMGRSQREALIIAERIHSLMAEDPDLRYRDIAILTRAKQSAFSQIVPVLLSEGIPAYAEGVAGYYDALEIRIALSLLRLLDNPRSDVELIGVLRSGAVGLDVEDLAQIRIFSRDTAFVDAARLYAQEGAEPLRGKLRDFFARFSSWQVRKEVLPLGEFVRLVLDESGLYSILGVLPGGARRQANLERLIKQAADFDRLRSGSLTRFLLHAQYLEQRGDADGATVLGENDDVVRLMTIHKSKGLEFPVVIGALTARSFRSRRGEDNLLAHRDLGIGMLYVDPKLRTRRSTLPFEAIRERRRREDAAEELRLLYVLLTRAKSRLILTGSVRNYETEQAVARASQARVGMADSHLQVVLGALLTAVDEGCAPRAHILCHSPAALRASAPARQTQEGLALFDNILSSPDTPESRALREAMLWQYPDALSVRRPLKLTASGLLRELEGPEEIPPLEPRPRFLSEEGAMTGAERGSAYHRALQAMDLAALRGREGAALREEIVRQLDSMQKKNLLERQQAAAISPAKLARFFAQDPGNRMLQAQTIRREWPFNVMLRVSEALESEAEDPFQDAELLVQGTIDCCFLEEGEWILLDYKTDGASDLEGLKRHYARQLGIYALALERITGIRVRSKGLCLLSSGKTLWL